jgi:peroxiredoxin
MGFLYFGLGLLVPVVGYLGWFCYQLLRQNGRILQRLEALERQLQTQAVAADPMLAPSAPTPVLPEAIPAPPEISRHPSLPVGSLAPDFTLPDLDGKPQTLSQWRGRPVLLIFFSARCGFCTEMAPDLAAMPLDGKEGYPMPLVVSNGTVQENLEWVRESGVRCPVLLQEQMEIANLYQATGTPMGYLLDAEGRIASEIAVGSNSLLALAGPPHTVGEDGPEAVHGRNGHAVPKGRRPLSESRIAREGLSAGTPAPDFRLPTLDGEEISLEQYRGQKVLLVFSDPQCGPCDALAPLLEQRRRSRPEVQFLMVSRGEIEANRAKVRDHHLTFPVLLQRKWEISKLYAMFATPVAYLIDEAGIITTDVAVGADEILALLSGAEAAPKKEVMPLHN